MRRPLGGVLGTLLALLVAGFCVAAGFWQLHRLEQRRALNTAIQRQASKPPLRMNARVAEAMAKDPTPLLYRRLQARGFYDEEHTLVLRARAQDGRPGVHILTPLQITGIPRTLLVNRGWVPSPDAATVDLAPLAEPGMQEVEGLLYPISPAGSDNPVLRRPAGSDTVRSVLLVDSAAVELLQEDMLYPLLPVRMDLLPDSARTTAPHRLPLPLLSEGNHLAYAVQWFSFAAIALGGWLLLVVRAARRRRPAP